MIFVPFSRPQKWPSATILQPKSARFDGSCWGRLGLDGTMVAGGDRSTSITGCRSDRVSDHRHRRRSPGRGYRPTATHLTLTRVSLSNCHEKWTYEQGRVMYGGTSSLRAPVRQEAPPSILRCPHEWGASRWRPDAETHREGTHHRVRESRSRSDEGRTGTRPRRRLVSMHVVYEENQSGRLEMR